VRAEVALPLPLRQTFTYLVPEEMRAAALPGARVLVPFGRRDHIGWIASVAAAEVEAEQGDAGSLRALHAVLDAEPTAPAELLSLSRWVADYYLASLGQVLRTALPSVLHDTTSDRLRPVPGAEPPPNLSEVEAEILRWLGDAEAGRSVTQLRRTRGQRSWWPAIRRLEERGLLRVETEPPRTAPSVRTERVLRITRELPTLTSREEAFGRAKRQRELYETVEEAGGSLETSHIAGQLGFSYPVIKGLVDRGLASIDTVEVARDPYAAADAPEGSTPVPTPAQRQVIDRLVAAVRTPSPGTFLLRGITGSGKTLVYLEVLKEVVERQGRTAIVLVPEISLTPQTVGRFRAVFGDRIAVLHSALSPGERYDEWRALRAGRKRIVVGARSAIFAPLPDLGAVVVDEEHEGSYKQGETPRYHAREVAVVRAEEAGALCLLGSATPSLESWTNARSGKYALLELPDRVAGGRLPEVRVVDLRAERGAAGDRKAPPGLLSRPLREAIEARLERGEQSILLLNRRGYSTFIQCRDCGEVRQCPDCNVSLTFHRRRSRLLCHHCAHQEPAPDRCPGCGSADLGFRGRGTEQVERVVGETFPAARLARMDVDTTSGKWSHHRILDRVERREVDILLGTQMIAKGLDFPNVTLVGVIDADVGINLPDFRASERTFQLVTQVAGRAGRGPLGGEVLVQTSLPGNPAVRCATTHDFPGFAAEELEHRREMGYPPFGRMLNLVVSGTEERAVQEGADEAATWLAGLRTAAGLGDELDIMGPAPCPIDRIRRRWRWHILLRSPRAAVIGRVGAYFTDRFAAGRSGDLRYVLDRDPVSVL
jgi:primosomal protein N' (replication factor Y) (superfamily II helicase)